MAEQLTFEEKQLYVNMMHDLTYYLMVIVFVKKNGDERVMLATRSRGIFKMEYGDSYSAMDGMDNKCGIHNGNISCNDMVIGEGRMFNSKRVLQSFILGEPKTKEEYSMMFDKFMQFKNSYTPVKASEVDITKPVENKAVENKEPASSETDWYSYRKISEQALDGQALEKQDKYENEPRVTPSQVESIFELGGNNNVSN